MLGEHVAPRPLGEGLRVLEAIRVALHLHNTQWAQWEVVPMGAGGAAQGKVSGKVEKGVQDAHARSHRRQG